MTDVLLHDPLLETDLASLETTLELQYDQLPSFLEFHSSFPRAGKQGILGLFVDTRTHRKYVYKISQYLNYLIEQEYTVMTGLNELRSYCPHFCKSLGVFRTRLSDKFRSQDNPFEVEKRSVEGTVLLMEHIKDARKLYRYIKNPDVPVEVLMSLLKQTMIATLMACDQGRFTHYDLHSNNVLVKECPTNSVFLYVLDSSRIYLVPTYGYMPVIIDFGFAFHQNCEGRPLFGALAHTDIGFVPSVHDAHADAKLFLTSVSAEMEKYRPCDSTRELRELITSIYGKCSIDLECGWDEHPKDDPLNLSVSDYLLRKMSSQFKRSAFFKNQGHHVVDLLQALIVLPIRSRNTEDTLDDLTGILVTEFVKIEREIGNDFYNLYVMRCIIDQALCFREYYLHAETREAAVAGFKTAVLTELDRITKFGQFKLNWEKLLCCLLCIGKCVENVCHSRMKALSAHKKSDYNQMLLRSTTEVYEAIDANVPLPFFFDHHTKVYVWDATTKHAEKFTVPREWVDSLNATHPFERGIYLHELWTKQSSTSASFSSDEEDDASSTSEQEEEEKEQRNETTKKAKYEDEDHSPMPSDSEDSDDE